MTRTERLLRLARLRGDRAAELILTHVHRWLWRPDDVGLWASCRCGERQLMAAWTEAELREAWGR